jgi:hypothetical protein
MVATGSPGQATTNLDFFIEHGVRQHSAGKRSLVNHVFVLVCQGVPAPSFVPRDMMILLERKNSGYDFEAWYHGVHAALSAIQPRPKPFPPQSIALWLPLLVKYFDKFVFINSSVRGPYLPLWYHNLGVSWTVALTGGLDSRTKLVGTTMNRCGGNGGWRMLPLSCSAPHVQSMVFATDRVGLELLFLPTQTKPEPLFSVRNLHGYNETIRKLEIGMSEAMRDAGFNVRAISMSELIMEKISRQDADNGGLGLHGDMQFENLYFGHNLNPLETLFWKTNRGYRSKITSQYDHWLDTWAKTRAENTLHGANGDTLDIELDVKNENLGTVQTYSEATCSSTELHLVIDWTNHFENIGEQLGASLTLLKTFHAAALGTEKTRLMSLFYGKHVDDFRGEDPFRIHFIRDEAPTYDYRKTTRGKRVVNTNMFDLKIHLRSFTGRFKVHATENIQETHDNLKALGLYGEHYERKTFSSLTDVFDALNRCRDLQWVVMRNFEKMPDEVHVDNHLDIDILVNDYFLAKRVLDAFTHHEWPYGTSYEDGGYRVLNNVIIDGVSVLFDIRCIGDNYYDAKFQTDMLRSRVMHRRSGAWLNFYVPEPRHHLYSLIYHSIIHKERVSKTYVDVFKHLGLSVDEMAPGPLYERLYPYMLEHNYSYTRPDDLSVGFFYRQGLKRCRVTVWPTNGLGERLRMMASAFVYADKHGCSFQLGWSVSKTDMHVPHWEDIFSVSFEQPSEPYVRDSRHSVHTNQWLSRIQVTNGSSATFYGGHAFKMIDMDEEEYLRRKQQFYQLLTPAGSIFNASGYIGLHWDGSEGSDRSTSTWPSWRREQLAATDDDFFVVSSAFKLLSDCENPDNIFRGNESK